MREFMRRLIDRLPLQFRVLYRQFLLRVIDLESLSIEADIPRFLGQFAGVLIMLSLIHILFFSGLVLQAPWYMEHHQIATMMLVIGLIAVVSWDATFPDRRDVMVLSPLPVAPLNILFAKVTASAAVLGLAIVMLNVATGVVFPMLLGTLRSSNWAFFQTFAAYWFTMIASSLFLYCSVLAVQGFTALVLPRRFFLRLSAILQLAAFGLFLGVYFLQPPLTTPAAMAAAENQRVLAYSPSYWFFALFNQFNGSLPPSLAWLARRAWIGLGLAIFGAAASLLLCYVHTMKKTVEQPDLVPGHGGFRWTLRFGSSLQTAIVLFSLRSIMRSRQHRIVLAFYLSMVFGIALSMAQGELSAPALRPLSPEFLIPTIVMMALAVVGFRNVFPLPISLNANWVLRVTQLCPSHRYIAATRWIQLLFAVLPVFLISTCLALSYRPLHLVVEHLAILALLGWVFAEISLVGFYKVPFTCSHLPGKTNFQFAFWGFVVVLLILALSFAPLEMQAIGDPAGTASLLSALGVVACGLWAFNRHRARSAVLDFEELPEAVITTLGLSSPPAMPEPGRGPITS
jgi:hypothetical protein